MEHWQIGLSGPIPHDVQEKRVFRGSNVTETSAQVMFWVLFARDNVNKPQRELNPAGAAEKIRLNGKDWLCFTDPICAWFAPSHAVKPKIQFVLKSKVFFFVFGLFFCFFYTHQYTKLLGEAKKPLPTLKWEMGKLEVALFKSHSRNLHITDKHILHALYRNYILEV